jgi:hypothetical protein
MEITLLDNSLIRRFGSRILQVDSSVGNTLINKRLAVENVKKQVKKPMIDKMVKEAVEDKMEVHQYSKEDIFPDLIVCK